MRPFTFLLLCASLVFLTSCGNCDDKTLQVNDDLLDFLPYTSETSVSFSNENNETRTYTISPDETVRIDDEDECTITSIQPYIYMQNDDQPEFLHIWFNRDEDLLGDRDQLWVIVKEDDQISGSGAISNINNLEDFTGTRSLNGTSFDDVITFDIDSQNSIVQKVYLQKDIGIIGFEYQDVLWVIN